MTNACRFSLALTSLCWLSLVACGSDDSTAEGSDSGLSDGGDSGTGSSNSGQGGSANASTSGSNGQGVSATSSAPGGGTASGSEDAAAGSTGGASAATATGGGVQVTSTTGPRPSDALLVPGGVLAMGRSAAGADVCPPEMQCHESEQPEHELTVASFRLDQTEVTVADFREWVEAYSSLPEIAVGAGSHARILGSGWQTEYEASLPPDQAALQAALACSEHASYSPEPSASDRLPINCVTWFEALAYCIWRGGRLPSEAEWEFAAAGGEENRLYPWGAEPVSPERAAVAVGDLVEAGSLSQGGGRFGHYELAGNVWEWTQNWLDPTGYQRQLECPDCAASAEGTHRALRGGAWTYPAAAARAAARSGDVPEQRSRAIGFRCAYDE